jgi:hypothetical protein
MPYFREPEAREEVGTIVEQAVRRLLVMFLDVVDDVFLCRIGVSKSALTALEERTRPRILGVFYRSNVRTQAFLRSKFLIRYPSLSRNAFFVVHLLLSSFIFLFFPLSKMYALHQDIALHSDLFAFLVSVVRIIF